MVFEKPVIDKRELLRALDPIHGRGGAEYERLRHHDMLSPGVAAGQLYPGRADDHLTLYCSLNRDAVTAVRRGHGDTARKIRDHAVRIEETTIAPWIQQVLSAGVDLGFEPALEQERERQGWLERVLFPVAQGDEVRLAEPVWQAAREIAEVRERFDPEDVRAHTTVGRVWRIDEELSEIRSQPPSLDETFAFFTTEVLAAGLRLGDPAVIRHEELGPGILLTTLERGLEPDRAANRLAVHPLPSHLDQLLDAQDLCKRTRSVSPLRRVA